MHVARSKCHTIRSKTRNLPDDSVVFNIVQAQKMSSMLYGRYSIFAYFLFIKGRTFFKLVVFNPLSNTTEVLGKLNYLQNTKIMALWPLQ